MSVAQQMQASVAQLPAQAASAPADAASEQKAEKKRKRQTGPSRRTLKRPAAAAAAEPAMDENEEADEAPEPELTEIREERCPPLLQAFPIYEVRPTAQQSVSVSHSLAEPSTYLVTLFNLMLDRLGTDEIQDLTVFMEEFQPLHWASVCAGTDSSSACVQGTCLRIDGAQLPG